MLTRTYRVADKLGVVALKSSLALVDLTLDGIGAIRKAAVRLFAILARIVWIVLRPFGLLLAALAGLLFGGARRTVSRASEAGSTSMARRAARAQIDSTVTEDPLRSQNRVLSGLIVILLAVLVGVVLWATGQGTRSEGDLLPVALDSGAGALVASPTIVAAVPTVPPSATPLPPALSARGTIAYVVRENGQSDIYAVPIGGRTPIRLTNDVADDRDPAWSPDGQRLAFASRRDGNWELYVYDTATGATRRLTTDLAFQGAPSWSNDGQYIVFEGYLGGDLGLYVLRTEDDPTPIAVPGDANSPAPEYSPSWSPDGRRIAFVSLREGNPDIYLYSLDDQSVVNLTRTPERSENHPIWSPDGRWIAFTALDAGQEKVFVISTDDGTSQVINFGRAPAWSPDGSSIAAAVDTIDGSQIVVDPFAASGTAAILPAPARTNSITWTGQPLPPALINSGGLPPAVTEPLFVEEEEQRTGDPPYRLNTIPGVEVEQSVLSDRVNDSFNALRVAANEQIGVDLLGTLDDAFWQIDRPPEPGVPRSGNWLLTGRAFALVRSGINGFPAQFEVVREDVGVETFWRVFVRVSEDAQSGQLGEPLRMLPWDFAARTSGDVEAYDQGGKIKTEMPSGYYVDFTELALDYGWTRAAAGRDWRANAATINFWLFEKRDSLTWFNAMRELYTEAQMGGFVPTPTPGGAQAPTIPAPTLQIQPSVIPATAAPEGPTEAAPVLPENPPTPETELEG
ncbi:MAG: PD40 domain-containing protein [Chloroflexi bacterium]|nr:PD40 domain-containing protein [Chloroflexota bacterium]